MEYKHNWLSWTFDEKLYSNKPTPNSKFNIFFNKFDYALKDIYTETVNNASYVYESEKKLTLFFSGGINSQIILRSYIDLKIPLEVVILKYKNDYNIEEYNLASSICDLLGVSYKILDFDIDTFFNNDAIDFYQSCYVVDLYKLILLKAATLVDNVPIIGNKFPYLFRTHYSYLENADWCIRFNEDDFALQSYPNRKIIGDWFHYSPELLLSMLDDELVVKLFDDKIYGKVSILSLRNELYRNHWDLVNSAKSSGLEKKENSFLFPSSMIDFFNLNVNGKVKKSNPINFTKCQFISQISL